MRKLLYTVLLLIVFTPLISKAQNHELTYDFSSKVEKLNVEKPYPDISGTYKIILTPNKLSIKEKNNEKFMI